MCDTDGALEPLVRRDLAGQPTKKTPQAREEEKKNTKQRASKPDFCLCQTISKDFSEAPGRERLGGKLILRSVIEK